MPTSSSGRRARPFREFHALVEALGDVVLVTTPEGMIEYLNPQGLNLLGVGQTEVVGRELSHFLTEQSQSVTTRWLSMPLDESRGLIFELEFQGRDQQTTVLEVRSEILSVRGQAASRIAVGRSLGDLVRAEASLTGHAIRANLLDRRNQLASHLYQVAQFEAARLGDSLMTAQALEWGLTDQQVQLLVLLAEGKTNRDIAGDLGVSPETIKDRVAELMRDLDTTRRTSLVAKALSFGLIPPISG